MKNVFSPLLIILTALMLVSCDEDEVNECFQCSYDKRKSSCSSASFGAWESDISGSVFSEDIKEGLTKQGYCDLVYPSNDLACAAGCCVSFQFKNVTVQSCD